MAQYVGRWSWVLMREKQETVLGLRVAAVLSVADEWLTRLKGHDIGSMDE